MKTTYLLLSILLFLFFSFNVPAQEKKTGLLAGSSAGTYIKIAKDIQEIAKGAINLKVYTGGSLGNIDKVLSDRNSQFAIVQYDALLYKKAYFDDKLTNKIKMIFPLYNEEIHLIVRKDTGINSTKDLSGKRVNMDKKKSGCWVTATIIKDTLDLTWKEFNYTPAEALQKLIDEELDAFFYVVGQPAPILTGLDGSASEFIKLVPLELDELYPSATFKANTYPWQKEQVKTNATKALLITYNYYEGNDAPERFKTYVKNIRALINAIYSNLSYLRENKHPKWKEIDPYEYKKVRWPLHYAAKKILLQGAPETDKEEKKKKLKTYLKTLMHD